MTKNELKTIIKECVDEILTESGNNSLESLEKRARTDKEIEYYNKIKKDKSWLVSNINKCSAEAFKTFRSVIEKDCNKDDDYDKETLKDLDDFYKLNKKAPKVTDWEWETDDIDFWLDSKSNSNDMDLFYQDHVVKYLNKSKELKSRGYSFESEDYIGIYIVIK